MMLTARRQTPPKATPLPRRHLSGGPGYVLRRMAVGTGAPDGHATHLTSTDLHRFACQCVAMLRCPELQMRKFRARITLKVRSGPMTPTSMLLPLSCPSKPSLSVSSAVCTASSMPTCRGGAQWSYK